MHDLQQVVDDPVGYIANYQSSEIPVRFEHMNKDYSGFLSYVSGTCGLNRHLSVNNYYRGTMHKVLVCTTSWLPETVAADHWKRQFSTQKGGRDYLIDYFESILIAWYE